MDCLGESIIKNYEENREWSNKFIPKIKTILNYQVLSLFENPSFIRKHPKKVANLFKLLNLTGIIETATVISDLTEATDLILRLQFDPLQKIDVACRMRQLQYQNFQDWTIRSYVRVGGLTEIHKLFSGIADWYFYGYGDNIIDEFIIIDLHVFNTAGKEILKEAYKNEHINRDGTRFISIPFLELKKVKCLLVHWNKSQMNLANQINLTKFFNENLQE